MIRQSFIDERISDLHHHTLQSSGDSDGDMSKPTSRRLPAPVASRIVVKKNSSLLPIGNETTIDTSSSTPSPVPTVDPRSRIDLLERNLRYVQQQHEITLADLHNEISILQHENRDLHFRMVNIRVPTPSESKQRKSEVVPNIHQLADLTQNEPILAKRLQEVQRLHFEKQIDELRTQLIETEQRNEYLIRTINELNKAKSIQTSQTSSSVVSVLLPDPNTSSDDKKIRKSEQTQMSEADYQHLLRISYEKQKQQIHEISRLRAVLREILHAERLSSTSKVLVRDCLANISENLTTEPMDLLNTTGNQQQRSGVLSSTAEKASLVRHELPLRRLNLSPPQFIVPRPIGQHRPSEQRLVLPPIISGSNTSSLQDSTGAAGGGLSNSSLNPTNIKSQQQQAFTFGETPIARRGRRTQELQRTRLTRNLYH